VEVKTAVITGIIRKRLNTALRLGFDCTQQQLITPWKVTSRQSNRRYNICTDGPL